MYKNIVFKLAIVIFFEGVRIQGRVRSSHLKRDVEIRIISQAKKYNKP